MYTYFSSSYDSMTLHTRYHRPHDRLDEDTSGAFTDSDTDAYGGKFGHSDDMAPMPVGDTGDAAGGGGRPQGWKPGRSAGDKRSPHSVNI